MKKGGLLLLIALNVAAAQAQTKNFIDQPYLEVGGTADTLVTPDEIFLKIVISERDTRDKVSVEEQESKMVAALKALSIDTEKDLTTNDIASNFKSYLFKGKEVVKQKEYNLKVASAVLASKVFMQLEALEISNASIDHVDYSAMEILKNDLRGKAVQNAKTRALALTKPLNQTVGAAINIVDDESDRVSNMLSGRAAGIDITGYARKATSQPEPQKIEFKPIPVATSVSVKFILK